MSKLITNLKCDACDNGVAMLIVTKRDENVTAEVKDCNVCKKAYGLKSIGNLKPIAQPNKPQ